MKFPRILLAALAASLTAVLAAPLVAEEAGTTNMEILRQKI
jgi:hypothetical protein